MSVKVETYRLIQEKLVDKNVSLVAVSKTKTIEDIKFLFELGQIDFGENYVQELVDKYEHLPKNIQWHFIGHLQSNKVKYIAPFVYLIHGVDSLKLLKEINKQAEKNNRVISCLLQIHIAQEETKFGLDENELDEIMKEINKNECKNECKNVKIKGLMGMASFSTNMKLVKQEFQYLKKLYKRYPQFEVLSMGMSADYEIAIEEGSNMIRIGSLLFGSR